MKSFGHHLRDWRKARGKSQLDLGLCANVSARHISFLETGRASPSRRMVHRIAESLELPLQSENVLLGAAGFAPRYQRRQLEHKEMGSARRALEFILAAHEPYPAFVLNTHWTILYSNEPHKRLLDYTLPPEARALDLSNALQLVFDPKLLRPFITDWNVVAPLLLKRLHRQLEVPDPDPALIELLEDLHDYPGVRGIKQDSSIAERTELLVPLQTRVGDQSLSWFSTIATFGTPQDITLQELWIESFFPADSATESFVSAGRTISGG